MLNVISEVDHIVIIIHCQTCCGCLLIPGVESGAWSQMSSWAPSTIPHCYLDLVSTNLADPNVCSQSVSSGSFCTLSMGFVC